MPTKIATKIATETQMHKALFLDRDGVINVDHGYVYQIEQFEFIEGIFELCQQAIQLGYQIIIVTNQSGIARGYYSEADLDILNQWLIQKFAAKNVTIRQIYYCPHHPDYGGTQYQHHCLCRKPKPGMMQRASRELNIDLSQSIMIGDKESDMQAAQQANIPTRILIQADPTEHIQNTSAATHYVKCLKEIAF